MESGKIMKHSERPRKVPRLLRRKSIGGAIFDVFNYIILIFFCFTILYPFWNTILLSFSEASEVTSLGFRLWIKNWNIQAYRYALSKYGNINTAYYNTIYRTLLGTILTVSVTLLAAYPLSKKILPGRNYLTIYILVTMFFSGGLIPSYLLIRRLGLYDSRWALILPRMALGFYVIIMRNFLMTIDTAYEDSAFLDGASYLQILIKIIIPLSKPVIAVIALWTAVMHWNSWFDALIYTKSESKIVLQLLLRRLIVDTQTAGLEEFKAIEEIRLPSEAVKSAITVLTIGPIIFAYPFLQRYFIKGVFVGSLKG